MKKAAVREAVWDDLEEREVARFPYPPHGRIPNFAGADDAAALLTETSSWDRARTIKINPDAPQRPVRQQALRSGKRLFMAVPRLREPKPFLELDPDRIDDFDEASTIGGASDHGRPVRVDEMPQIDLVVSGSVAVDRHGTRVGKGEGYSDIEYAILREFDCLDADTPVVTTVHERQIWPDPLDSDPHDVPITQIVTPERHYEPESVRSPPTGIDWSVLDSATIEAIPILASIRDD